MSAESQKLSENREQNITILDEQQLPSTETEIKDDSYFYILQEPAKEQKINQFEPVLDSLYQTPHFKQKCQTSESSPFKNEVPCSNFDLNSHFYKEEDELLQQRISYGEHMLLSSPVMEDSSESEEIRGSLQSSICNSPK